jgi:hypothetical protein
VGADRDKVAVNPHRAPAADNPARGQDKLAQAGGRHEPVVLRVVERAANRRVEQGTELQFRPALNTVPAEEVVNTPFSRLRERGSNGLHK